MSSKLILYGVILSPYTRKVMVALNEKNIDYVLVNTLPTKYAKAANKIQSADFLEASPLGKIPAIKDGNFKISDSSAIIQYLEVKYPNCPLIPKGPENLSHCIWFEKYADEYMVPVIGKKIFFEKVTSPSIYKNEVRTEIIERAINNELPLILNYLEQELKGKEYLVNNEFSLADISIVSQLFSLKVSLVEINSHQFPFLSKYFSKIISRPSFARAVEGIRIKDV